MRLIYGIIVVEGKGRVARVGKVMKHISITTTAYIVIEKTYMVCTTWATDKVLCLLVPLHTPWLQTLPTGMTPTICSLPWYAFTLAPALTFLLLYRSSYFNNHFAMPLYIHCIHLGGYDKEDKAARAYDLAALKYWGTTTTTNFPVRKVLYGVSLGAYNRSILTCFLNTIYINLCSWIYFFAKISLLQISNYEKELEEMKHMTRQEYIAYLRRYYFDACVLVIGSLPWMIWLTVNMILYIQK